MLMRHRPISATMHEPPIAKTAMFCLKKEPVLFSKLQVHLRLSGVRKGEQSSVFCPYHAVGVDEITYLQCTRRWNTRPHGRILFRPCRKLIEYSSPKYRPMILE